jgi:glucokinase-like ROK family protein
MHIENYKAAPSRARAQNTQLVLRTIYMDGPISRADLSRISQLTPPTISDMVAGLIKDGLVEEMGLAPSSGGRRAILLRIVDHSRQLIGIDLSRRDFRGALSDLRGNIQQRSSLPLEGADGEIALNMVYDLVDSLIDSATSPILGIGIGVPGLVDAANGVLQQSVNLNWRHIPLRNLLQQRYGLPVYLANDSQASALAAYAAQNRGNSTLPFVVINLGWGVGAGIILNGQLLHGSPVGAGEIGHVRVVQDGEQCACGHYGCLETIASSRAIVNRLRNIAAENPKTSIGAYVGNPDEIDLEIVIQAFNEGNQDVREVILEAGTALGVAAANLVGVLGSCRILIGGNMIHFGQFLLDAIRDEMGKRTLPALARDTELGMAEEGSDMVMIGASALILQQELGLL